MNSIPSKTNCVICSKSTGQFKCEGCSQIFCKNHVLEHRQALNEQLNEINLEYNTILKTNNEREHQLESLLTFIKQWEQTSIDKIKQMAEQARQTVTEVADTNKKQRVSQQLQLLYDRIGKAREDEDFFETDLRYWISIIQNLQRELTISLSNVEMKEDKTKPLIYQIQIPRLSSSRDTGQIESHYENIELNLQISDERFDRVYGNAAIEGNGYFVTNGNDSFFGTEIRGRVKYSLGKHQLRFRIENNPSKILILIGIVSSITPMGGNLFVPSSVYGWGDYDDYFMAGERQRKSSEVYFVHTQENDIIELIIDCTKRAIRYTNHRNRKSQEFLIDLNTCPFPWQLYISLGGGGDQIRLLKSINED